MNLKYQYRYVTSLLKRYGFRGLVFKTLERSRSPMLLYTKRYRQFMPDEAELARQRDEVFAYAPLISIVAPAYETPERYLRELIHSVLEQSYQNFELCIADGSVRDRVQEIVAEYAARDGRIRYQKLSENGGISENTNRGFDMAGGEYIVLMDHDDLLAKNALYEMASCLNREYKKEEREYAMIYSDEDKINGDGTVHSRPHFKPDYNREFLRHNNYICHLLCVSARLLKKAGGLNKEYDGAQDYDFVLRCVDVGAVVRHVPKILYHWRIHEGSTAGNSENKAYAFDNGCRAIEAHLKRCGDPGRAGVTANLGVYHVSYELKGDYELTVVAENREQLSKIRSHYQKQKFTDSEYSLKIHYLFANSFHNGIEKECMGDYILYIRNDVRVNPKGLIETLLGTCRQEQVGIVGAKLITQKKRVASCGMIYNEAGDLIFANEGIYRDFKGYFLHAVIPQNVSAVSFGCVMFKRDAFVKAGGLDETMKGVYQDADFCFRLAELGYDTVVTPEITALWHMKKAESGLSEERQRKLFFGRWERKLSEPDPCYNPNLSAKPRHTYTMKNKEEIRAVLNARRETE